MGIGFIIISSGISGARFQCHIEPLQRYRIIVKTQRLTGILHHSLHIDLCRTDSRQQPQHEDPCPSHKRQ